MLARVHIKVSLYDENSQMVHESTALSKTRVLNSIQGKNLAEWTQGYVKVTYDKKLGYWNAGYFSNKAELKAFLDTALEKELVDNFKG